MCFAVSDAFAIRNPFHFGTAAKRQADGWHSRTDFVVWQMMPQEEVPRRISNAIPSILTNIFSAACLFANADSIQIEFILDAV